MIAIIKREISSAFHNIIGWIYVAVVMAAFSLYYFANNLSYGSTKISYSVSGILFIIIIPVAVLTMKSLAEERRSKTDQLILTSPLSVGKIVVAKFVSMAAIHGLTTVYMLIMTLVLNIFGDTPIRQNVSAVFGFFLYGMACIAVGLFVSSLTESQMIAAVLTFAALFIGYMMSGITSLISEEGNIITKILSFYDLRSPVEEFMDGVLPIDGIIYYLIIIALMLFLTTQSIQKRRWSFSAKKMSLGIYSSSLVIIAVVISVVMNLVAESIPTDIASIDLTSQKLYTLTDETKEFLSTLENEVDIYVLQAEESMETTVAETLKRYESASDKIKVTYVDPAKNPTFYKDYTDSSVSSGSLIVTCGDVSRVIDYNDLFESSYDYYSYSSTVTGYDGEGQITSAIQYVVSDELPVAYELTGHGETALSGTFTDALSKANISVSSINLLEYDSVPEDCEVLIINAPTSDFSSDDADKVKAYVNAGGKLFVTTSYEANDDMTNFESVLSVYGLTLADGIIAEQSTNNYYQNPFYLLPVLNYSSYSSLETSDYVFMPYAKGVVMPEDTDDVAYTVMLQTSGSAVAKANVDTATTYEAEEGDTEGTFALGLVANLTIDDESTSSLALFTSSLMFSDEADSMVSGNNSKMFSDVISSYVDTDGIESIVIPVKEYDTTTLTIAASVLIVFGVVFVVALPLALIIVGIVIWMRRRKK